MLIFWEVHTINHQINDLFSDSCMQALFYKMFISYQ